MTAPLRIAGACGAGAWPENSLEAARRCLAAPVDGIEVDVHLTADRVPVLHHDYALNPDATRRDGHWIDPPAPLLKDLTAAELARYDVGRTRAGSPAALAHPEREQWDGTRIPTLAALLAMLASRAERPLLYVEIKTDAQRSGQNADPVALTNAVIAALRAVDYLARARVIAFDWRVLRIARDAAPGLARGHLVIPEFLSAEVVRGKDGASAWTDGADPVRFGGSLGAAVAAHGGTQMSLFGRDIGADVVADAGRHGIGVAAWGLREPGEIARLAALGVDSVTLSGPRWTV